MTPKDKPGKPGSTMQRNQSKFATQKNAAGAPSGKLIDSAFLKKNEFGLILLGALLLTLIVFFVFFKSSGSRSTAAVDASIDASNASLAALEKRMENLETATRESLAEDTNTPIRNSQSLSMEDITALNERVSRLETAYSLKLDMLIDRMDKLESSLAQAKQRFAETQVPVKSVAAPVKAVTPIAAASGKPPVKKATTAKKKTAIFYTVKKGDTLYSISKKYKTSVAALRKLNNLSEKDDIYPGSNLIVR